MKNMRDAVGNARGTAQAQTSARLGFGRMAVLRGLRHVHRRSQRGFRLPTDQSCYAMFQHMGLICL